MAGLRLNPTPRPDVGYNRALRTPLTDDESVMAFTDFGLDTLSDLIKLYKADPGMLKRWNGPE